GCLHDAMQRIVRPFVSRRWIACLLEFKGRRRIVMTPNRYTELFFLDEATALAAGHRPCAECQRIRYDVFREHWAAANPDLATAPRLGSHYLHSFHRPPRRATRLGSHYLRPFHRSASPPRRRLGSHYLRSFHRSPRRHNDASARTTTGHFTARLVARRRLGSH